MNLTKYCFENNITKSQYIRDLVSKKDYVTAMNIAGKFPNRRKNSDLENIILARECLIHPNMYKQLKYDLNKVHEEGIASLERYYGVIKS